jgi:hypothetical protein
MVDQMGNLSVELMVESSDTLEEAMLEKKQVVYWEKKSV